ncbi:MAG: hypothetical protein ACTHON_19170 [Humibacter sp.]
MSTDAPKPTPAKPDASTPPWGDDFDPARAWATITRQREAEQGLKARIAELETAAEGLVPKAELDAALTRADAAETTLKTSKRAAALAKADLPEELHAFVTAEDDHGMAEQIAKLTAAIKPGTATAASTSTPAPARPAAELTPGHGGDEAPTFNADALATSVHGKGRG